VRDARAKINAERHFCEDHGRDEIRAAFFLRSVQHFLNVESETEMLMPFDNVLGSRFRIESYYSNRRVSAPSLKAFV
jgi:hypothetical protein